MRFKRPLLVVGAILIPLLVGATSPQLVDSVRTFTADAIQPLIELQNQVAQFFEEQIQSLLEWPNLRQENRFLQDELRNSKADLIGFEEMKHRLSRLEALLRLKEKVHGRSVAARVIVRDPSSWSQFVVINRGLRDGVRKDWALVHPDGLVGKVISSGHHSSRAILLIDSESRVSAMNQRTRDVGLIEGSGSLILKMTYLDRQSSIQVGDLIISSGLGGIYPKGVPIGKVEVVGEDKNHLTLYALVKPFVSFSKLEDVLCVSSRTNA